MPLLMPMPDIMENAGTVKHPPAPAPASASAISPQTLKYLLAYPDTLQAQVRHLLAQGRLADMLLQKYPHGHCVQTDRSLYDYVMALKGEFLRSSPPLSKIAFDNRLQVIAQALGTHTTVSRVQGSKL